MTLAWALALVGILMINGGHVMGFDGWGGTLSSVGGIFVGVAVIWAQHSGAIAEIRRRS